MKNETQTYGDEAMGGDAEYDINWDEVGSNVPVGLYDFEIVDSKYQLSKTSQKHMVVVRLNVVGVHDQENAETAKNKSVFENFVFTAAAGFRVKGFAKAAGIGLPTTINKTILEEWAGTLLGQQVTGLVVHRDFNGEPKATISKFMTIGSTGETEETAEEEQAPPPPAASSKRTGNGAATQGIRAAVAGQKNGTKANGHTNGTNGIAKSGPGKKPAGTQKAQARK
jgi:hypothetical protein